MPDPRSWDEDEAIARLDRRHLRLALSVVVHQLAPLLGDPPCRAHATTEECIGNKAMVILRSMGIEVMPTDLIDMADEALAAAAEGGRVVVIKARPTMFDLPVVLN